jgi:hypothetical protein
MSGHDEVFLDPVEPRLTAAFALRLAVPGPAPSEPGEFVTFARGVGERFAAVANANGWSLEPPFPGRTPGLECIDGVFRLVFAARISGTDGAPLGVAFTTLIAGRRPEVGVAPPQTPIPEDWTAL